MFLNEFKRFRKAFTLAELLIALGVLGALAALTLPYLFGSMPDKNDAKIKKVTYQIETVVAQMYDDDTAYPKKSDISAIGFQNVEKVSVNGKDYGANGNTDTDIKNKNEKFAKLFMDRFSLASSVGSKISAPPACSSSATSCKPPTDMTFRTNDGVEWYLPSTDFSNGYSTMMIDIDGPEGPNCYADPSNAAACPKPDRKVFYITRNGTVATSKPTKSDSSTHSIMLTEYHHITSASASVGGGVSSSSIKYKSGNSFVAASGVSSKCGLFSAVEAGKIYKRTCEISGLKEKTLYSLTAEPKKGFHSDWVNDTKKIRILDTDQLAEVTYSKAVSRCINVKIENCSATNPGDCLSSAKWKSDCKYVAGTKYKQVKYDSSNPQSLAYYEYVGSGGTHNYTCSGTENSFTISSSDMNRYKTDPTTNTASKDTAAIGRYLHYCGNIVSDYQIVIKPNTSKAYHLDTYDSTITDSDTYTQNVHSGTEDIDFVLTLKKL